LYLLGLDVGTTGCKAIIFSPNGKIVSSAYEEYQLHHRKLEWAELNPEEVWAKVVMVTRRSIADTKLDPKEIKALAVSSLGEAFMPIDKEGKPLYWSMLFMDERSREYTLWLEEHIDSKEVFRMTGQTLSSSMPVYTLPRIMWLRKYEPEVYKNAWKFLLWEDFVNFKLSGVPVIDYTLAARTMMLDIRKKKWNSEILELAGLEEDQLPSVHLSGTVVGEVQEGASKEIGLAKGTLVVTGGHDQPCGLFGCGVIESGPLMDSTGTVECFGIVQRELTLTDKILAQGFPVHPYVLYETYDMLGFNPTSGVVLRWFRDNLSYEEREEAKTKNSNVYDLLMNKASQSPLGSLGLFFMPYFEGSGTPTFNRNAKGAFIGLTLAHGKKDIIRSITEGLSYELRLNIECIEEQGTDVTEIRAIGGGARSDFWLQVKADVTGRKIVVPNITEAAALGAATLAGLGSGVYKDAKDVIKQTYGIKKVITPDSNNTSAYKKYYEIYKGLYNSLKTMFDEMATLRTD